MGWNEDKRSENAHKLALEHDPHVSRTSPILLQKQLEEDVWQLRSFVKELHEQDNASVQPAEEWLLDHSEFIESEAAGIREEITLINVKSLPVVGKGKRFRVSSICESYLEQTDGLFDEETFAAYLASYQEISVLTIAEAWSIPLYMKLELVRRLAVIMKPVKERRAISGLVERMLSGILPSDLTPERLKQALEAEQIELPLSGALVVQLVKHLREHAEDSAHIGEWLVCKLENEPESLDAILSYEYQLQAEYQVSTGNVIASLRKLSRLVWSGLFEEICVVEQTLRGEQAGDYPRLDSASRHTLRHRVQKLAQRMKVPENLVATQAVSLANAHYEQENGGELPLPSRGGYTAYYLLDARGLRKLQQALKLCGKTGALPEAGIKKRAAGLYIQSLALGFSAALAASALWIGLSGPGTWLSWMLVVVLLALPASEFGVTALHWLIERIKRPTRLLRYDFSKGIPESASTMVAIPVIWSRVEEVTHITHRLELHYLANRDPNIHFAILSDFRDGEAEHQPGDDTVLEAAKAEIERLNRTYPDSTFHLLHRRRMWNPVERTWMGWERKRGKLVEFVRLLKGNAETSYSTVLGDSTVLQGIRYVITLDADTQLPLESGHRMIGAIHLPYNRPRLNETGTRVVEGYGVLQPRIGMTYESTQQSRLSSIWAAEPGLDPYAFAVSDPYQDAMEQGIFTGKGIFQVEAFDSVLGNRFPENRVLSHDLLEGGFLRAGFLADIELIDDSPATFLSHQKRLHRWTRGDWQLLPWLKRQSRNGQEELVPTDLSLVTRWQIVDNLRRSLLQPVLMATLLLAAPLLPGSAVRWYTVVLLTLFLPVVRQLLTVYTLLVRPGSLVNTFVQVLIGLMTLPFQSMMLMDAAIRTLYRLGISRRRLLEWVNQSEVDRLSGRKGVPALSGMTGGYLLIVLMAAGLVAGGGTAVRIMGGAMVILWSVAPAVIRWLDQAPVHSRQEFAPEEARELHKLAREIWSFYEDYVTGKDHDLPPDNVQFEPDRGIAHRTSPTNIGLYLTCLFAARDFGFIDTPALVERLERTVGTIERMEKWEGHLYNWYDTVTLAPLNPVYVSTVDSGNFVACLMTAREGLLERIDSGLDDTGRYSRGRKDRWSRQEFEVAFAEELSPSGTAAFLSRGSRLADRIDALIRATNFRALYDPKTNLFSLGYHVKQRALDNVLYDLMASEARQASFVAIALGQISVSHWNALGRTLTKVDGRPVLLSWSGTMFEYLMPWLLLRTYRNTLWDSTYQAVVRRQIDYARKRGVPFGISESGYYAFDHQMNYQYRAFGVPGLGFKRGLEQDLVLAPYATVMALPFAGKEALQSLGEMEKLGARGPYGYYEAVDCTPRRMPEGRKAMVIKSFMAHHQGMSMLTLANLLLPQTMYDRFHRNKEVQAAELLLQERIPKRPKWIRHPAMHRSAPRGEKSLQETASVREFRTPHTPTPEVCLLSNGKFTSMVTASGSGFCSWDGLAVTRWREEPVRDCWGSYVYIWDVAEDRIWSPSYQPGKTEAAEGARIRFELDKATFSRRDGDIETSMEICVSPEADAEVRRITLINRGDRQKVLEVTSYAELALANSIADDAHPAFSKLFIRTAYDEQSGCLVAGRRKREAKDRALWSASMLTSDSPTLGPAEFETDRSAFVGRGYTLEAPQAIRTRLKAKTGSVADPAFIMRRRVQLEPGDEVQLYAVIAVADSREEAVGIVSRLSNAQMVERSFQLAWNRSRIELRSLHLAQTDAAHFQRMAGQILYTSPLSPERSSHINGNAKGQSGLWSFGVSGDRPVMLVYIDNKSHLPFIMRLLTGHEYLRRLGLRFDLVILNQSGDGYQQNLQESLQRAAEHGIDRFGAGAAGIHVIADSQLGAEERTLLAACARVTLRAGGASLSAQLRLPRTALPVWPEPLPQQAAQPAAGGEEAAGGRRREGQEQGALSLDPQSVQFYNGWGGFTPDGKQYKLMVKDGKHLPAPWINVLANPGFGALVSELGTGYTFARNSRECKVTSWSNDPVLDPPSEMGYLREEDSGDVWTLTPAAGIHTAPYLVTHGRGFSEFQHQSRGIAHSMRIFVPLEDPVKIIRVRLRNTASRTQRLAVTYYAEWVLGVQRQGNASYLLSQWDETATILTVQNRYQETFREASAFLGIYPQNKAAAGDLSWTADQLEFIGRNGSVQQPAALGRTGLSNRTEGSSAGCGAIQSKLALQAGEETEVIIVLGCESSPAKAAELALKYSTAASCDEAWEQMAGYWDRTLDQIVVDTPSPETNILLNGWLVYQSLACRMWARSAFYQAGGAYGFRDQLQDSLALLHTAPELARRQIILHASHQYVEGDVQHWWHEETERGIRTLFSDDLLWLPYTASRYVEHTGDETLFAETAPYLESGQLRQGEHERYEPTVQSGGSGTVYEHCIRAIDKALERIGEHGLPLIGVGDWNDGMNLVGDEGRGESVWLAWFLCDVLQRFAPVCAGRGEPDREQRYRLARTELQAAADSHAWDGQWYRRAFTDAGTWLGSIQNEECRIDAIAQSWSVISEAAPLDRARQAMQSFDRELVDRELSVVRLLTPPFDHTEPSPGYIQGYPPGIRENGAQYTHGVIWGMVAWSKLGQGDKAFELFHMLNPITHTRTDQEVRQYVGEPYVMAADVYTSEPHRGHAGWTWYTGAASWMYQCGIEWILGLQKRGDKLYLNPCVPAHWSGFKVSYRHGGATYVLDFSRNGAGVGDADTALPGATEGTAGKELPRTEGASGKALPGTEGASNTVLPRAMEGTADKSPLRATASESSSGVKGRPHAASSGESATAVAVREAIKAGPGTFITLVDDGKEHRIAVQL
ncbi:MAG: glycosyltransferase [Paenibacillaceae bacterium]|jgi:cellobiose phosphorylase|nr:glycosyltransferase [Paenibacillaceae bacterium]